MRLAAITTAEEGKSDVEWRLASELFAEAANALAALRSSPAPEPRYEGTHARIVNEPTAAEGQRDERAQALEDALQEIVALGRGLPEDPDDEDASLDPGEYYSARMAQVARRALASGTTHQEGT